MKVQKIDHGFCVLPNIDIVWMPWILKNNKVIKVYDIRFSWLFWMLTTTNIIKFLNKTGYR